MIATRTLTERMHLPDSAPQSALPITDYRVTDHRLAFALIRSSDCRIATLSQTKLSVVTIEGQFSNLLNCLRERG